MRKLLFALLVGMSLCVASPAQEITLPQKPKRPEYIDYSSRTHGFFAAAQVSPTLYFDNEATAYYATQIDLVAGYRFNEFIKAGIGISPKIYVPDFGKGISLLPLYLDLRGNFMSQQDRGFSPYWNLDIGYTLNAGFMLAPTLGFRFGPLRHNFLVGLGYIYQSTQEVGYNVHGAVLRLGYEF